MFVLIVCTFFPLYTYLNVILNKSFNGVFIVSSYLLHVIENPIENE